MKKKRAHTYHVESTYCATWRIAETCIFRKALSFRNAILEAKQDKSGIQTSMRCHAVDMHYELFVDQREESIFRAIRRHSCRPVDVLLDNC